MLYTIDINNAFEYYIRVLLRVYYVQTLNFEMIISKNFKLMLGNDIE